MEAAGSCCSSVCPAVQTQGPEAVASLWGHSLASSIVLMRLPPPLASCEQRARRSCLSAHQQGRELLGVGRGHVVAHVHKLGARQECTRGGSCGEASRWAATCCLLVANANCAAGMHVGRQRQPAPVRAPASGCGATHKQVLGHQREQVACQVLRQDGVHRCKVPRPHACNDALAMMLLGTPVFYLSLSPYVPSS